jgi:hypothetical protein
LEGCPSRQPSALALVAAVESTWLPLAVDVVTSDRRRRRRRKECWHACERWSVLAR